MQPLDNKFFEEYKRVDRICADMYASRQGISEYIADMESRFQSGKCRIENWEHDYKQLKHLRWIRNRIAHESTDYEICSISDLRDIQNFYNRILSGSDPVAKLEQSYSHRRKNSRVSSKSARRGQQYQKTEVRKKGCCVLAFILIVFFIAAAAVCLKFSLIGF